MKKLVLSLILATICGISAFAYDFSAVCESGQTLYYTITSSSSPYKVEVVSQNTTSPYYSTYPTGDLTIPLSVTYNSKTYSVASIGNVAFYGCSELTSVTIPNSVTSIGGDAFENCNGLTEVTIPNSVTSIGGEAFSGCSGLTTVNFTATNCTTMGSSSRPVFYGCSSLTTLNIGESVRNIPAYAFKYCSGLTSVTIPNSVTRIGESAFYNCSGLTSVTIPNSVTSIGSSAFSGCRGLTSVTIGNSVTSIGESAFYHCSGLTSVTIGNSVTRIGSGAFSGCSGLTGTLTIPNSVTYIGGAAFSGCSGLEEMIIPFVGGSATATTASESSLFGYIFGTANYTGGTAVPQYYSNYTTYYIPSSLRSVTVTGGNLLHGAFYGCSMLTSVTIGNGVNYIDDFAFCGCSGLTGTLTIPNSVESIGDYAFSGCNGLTGTLTIPNSVESIGDHAFYGCSGLTTVNFNATNCTSMGSSVWSGCSSLSTLNIGENVTNIPANAFSGCSGLTTVNFNATNCTSMGSSVWSGCPSLSTLNIGENVTNIPNYAFDNCSGLTAVYYSGTIAQWCGITFGNNSANPLVSAHNLYIDDTLITDLVIPNTVTEIKDNAFSGATCLTSVTIPNSITSIGSYAFYSCNGLTGTLTIPNSVTSIGDRAFYKCSGLTSVTVGSGVSNIGQYAFYNCSGLTAVYYSGTIAQWCGITFGNNSANPLVSAHNLYIDDTLITDLVIPNTVTEIKDNAFSGATCLTSVTIPNSITSIGSSAFSGCNGLTGTLTIPNSVESIGDYAFSGCNGLTGTLTIPNSVESIGDYAFYGCSGLTTVNFNATNCTSMGSSVWSGCSSLSTLNIGENVTNIPANAFSGCTGLTSVTIPNSVTSIGNNAFYNVKNIVYGGTATGTPWGALTVNGYEDGYLIFSDETKTYLTGCSTQATEVTIPNSVTNIGARAFADCKGLTTIIVPDSVKSIGSAAFTGCSSLDTVNFNAVNCTTMGSSSYPVFSGCTSLTTLNIGENVRNIPAYAFIYCSGLTTVNFNAANCTTMGSSDYPVFNGCTSLATLNIDENVRKIPAYAFYGCRGLTSVTIGNSVTSIGSGAFFLCSGLTSVTIPNSVTSIGSSAFSCCSGLEEMIIPFVGGSATATTASESSLFGYIFGTANYTGGTAVRQYYSNYTTYYIPSSLRSVTVTGGNLLHGAFYGCSMLTSVTIGNGVNYIDDYAFYGCSGLTSVTIGNRVTSIGNSAFYACTSLTAVYYTGNIAKWCRISFGNGYSSTPLFYAHNLYVNDSLVSDLVIPNTVTEIKMHAFHGARCLTSVSIPNTVTSIGTSAFGHCYGLTSVTIPESVTNIDETAFYRCDGLDTVNFNAINCTVMGSSDNPVFKSDTLAVLNIGENVTNIPQYAFYGCSRLSTVNFNAENCEASGTETDPVFPSSALSKITFGESVRRVPDYAFYSSLLVDTIISYAVNPPTIYAHTFNFSEFPLSIPVIVPCGTVELYNDANYWYNFRRIQQRAGCGATFTITVQSNNSNYGTVSGGGIYEANAVAILTATPSNGCYFRNWSDGSRENPHRVTVTEDATYIATFLEGEPEPDITHSFSASACGSYTWNDHTYTQSGTYTQTFTAANYADSVVTLTLTIYDNLVPQISQSGELDACNPSSVTLSAGDYSTYNWSTGANTATISISEPGYYYVEVTDENGCTGISEQMNVGLSNALTEAPQISVVGMNSENRNVVAWSALDNENVNSYRIYRENNVANVYEPMATVEALRTTWTDSTADPTARAYRYKVTAVDECGGESPMSDYHKTMHLTINQGLGNTWNLIWSHYEGFNFGTYRIYRGTSPSNMTMIGEVPSNLNSYTDNTATDNTGFYYQVEVVRNTRSRDAEISSRSNIVDNGIFPEYTITVMSANPNRGTVTGGGTYPEGTVITIEAIANEGFEFASWNDENTDNPRQITVTADATYIASFIPATGIEENASLEISLFPNPANDILNISSSETISEIEIVNVMGQVVKRIEVNADNAVCDVEELTSGVYVVRIRTLRQAQEAAMRKFIKE